jgi:hypothetical protein
MLPAVAMRQFVPRNARVINAGDEAPAGNAASTTTINIARARRLTK